MKEYCCNNYPNLQLAQFEYKDYISENEENRFVHTWIIRDKNHITNVFARIVANVTEDEDCLFEVTYVEYELCFMNLVSSFFSYVKNSMSSYASTYCISSSPKKYLFKISIDMSEIGNSLFLQNSSPTNNFIINNVYNAYFEK